MKDEYTFDNNEMLRQKIRQILPFGKRQKGMVYFEGRFPDFKAAREIFPGKGYEDDQIFARVMESATAVKEGRAVYKRDGYLFYVKEYYLELLAILYEVFLLYGELNVIDFGGSLGSTYFQHKEKLTLIFDRVKWNIVEQKHFVDWGKRNLEDGVLRFYYDIDEIEKCNCIVYGGSLQCLEDCNSILLKVKDKGIPYVIVDRAPVSNESWVSVQYVHEPIYEAAYPVYTLTSQKRGLIFILYN